MHKGTYADDCLVNRVTQVFFYFSLIKTNVYCIDKNHENFPNGILCKILAELSLSSS